jgi:hypothetical protein
MKWMYGDSWERFPIEPGEVWGIPANGSRVAVHNVFHPLPSFMGRADLLFIDPPWNLGNLKSFYTKAELSDYPETFSVFADALFHRIKEIEPRTVYLEIGKQSVDNFYERLDQLYPSLQRWPVTYYRKHPTWLLRGSSQRAINYNFTGIDEAACISIIARIEQYHTYGDMCMGRGLVGVAAHQARKPFVGTELNKRRIACLLDTLAKLGTDVCKYEGETV